MHYINALLIFNLFSIILVFNHR